MLDDAQLTPSVAIDKIKLSYAYVATDPKGREEWLLFQETVNSMKLYNGLRAHACGEHSWSKFSIGLAPGSRRLSVGYGYTHERFRSSVEWTDSSLSATGRLRLGIHLRFLYAEGFETLWSEGRVAKIELACDWRDICYENHLFAAQGLSRHDPTNQNAGTTVLGDTRKGTRAYCCYDKGKQLWVTKMQLLDHRLLRIEAVLNPSPRVTLHQIASLPNPFAKLFVIPLRTLQVGASNNAKAVPQWLQRFRQSASEGIPAQTAYLASANRPALTQYLRTLRPGWFKPDEIWARVPGCLATLQASLRHPFL